MNSSCTGIGKALARSVMNMTAPLSTPTSKRSERSAGWSAATCFASSVTFSLICCSVMSTEAMSPSYTLRSPLPPRLGPRQPAMRAAHLQAAWQPHATLTTPFTDQPVHSTQLRVCEFPHARLEQPPAQHPATHRGGLSGKHLDVRFAREPRGDLVERFGVLTQLRGGPR